MAAVTYLHGKVYEDSYLRQEYQDIARIAYYANQETRRLNGQEPVEDWYSVSRLAHDVYSLAVQTVIENPDITPMVIHQMWCESKERQGWVFGKKECNTNKTHPCLVDFDKLELRDKVKNYVFISTTLALARDRGLI